MVALDPVSQEFTANVDPYLAGIEEMIAATDRFRESVDAALRSVEELGLAFASLPDEKTIHVHVETDGMPEAAAAAAGAGAAGVGDTAGLIAETEAARAARDAADEADVSFRLLTDSELASMNAALQDALATGDLSHALHDVAASAETAAVANGNVARSSAEAGAAAAGAGAAANRAYGWWGLLTREVTLWGGVLGDAHLIGSVQLWHIALDGLFESAVALGEGLAALSVGVATMVPTAEDIYTHLQAVHTVTSALGVDIPPVTGKFQDLAQAMEPGTLEAYGGALDLINSKGTVLAHVAQEVVAGLDDWIAKLDVWKASQADTGSLLENGVGFLHQFEEMLDNVGIAIDNLMKADPGTAHYLMDLVVGFTKVLDVITEIPAPILQAALALHSFMMWGGLLATGLVKLLTPIRAVAAGLGGISAASSAVKNLGEDASGADRLAATLRDIGTGFAGIPAVAAGAAQGALQFARQIGLLGTEAQAAVIPMTDLRTAEAGLALESDSLAASFLALASNPFTWIAAAAAALVAVSIAAANAKTSTQQWVNWLEQGVSQARGLAQIGQTYEDLTQVTGALTGAQQQLATATAASGAVMGTVQGRLTGTYSSAVATAANNVSDLSGAQQQLSKDFGNEVGNVELLSSKYKVSYVEAAEMAGMANADLATSMRGNSTAAKENLQLVQNLVAGYGGVAAVQGALGSDVNAVTAATELQNSKVNQLNQSWDTMMQTVQGPSAGFLSFAQSLQQFSSDATTAGARMTGLGGASTKAAHDVSDASIQLQSDFNTSATAANSMADSLRITAAITGNGGPLIQGIKDEIAVLIPMAGSNKAAAAQIQVLGQEAFGSVMSLSQLKQATSGVANPMQNLYNLSQQAALSLANMGQDAQNLANTIQSSLNQTLVQQAQALTGVSARTADYLTDLKEYGPDSAITQAALAGVNSSQSEANYLASQGAASINTLSGKQANYGSTLRGAASARTAFNSDLSAILARAPTAGGDVNALANAVANHGIKSNDYRSARAQLIRDLESAGVQAHTAAGMVDGLASAVSGLHSKTITITTAFNTSGSNLFPGAANVNKLFTGATGGRVPGYGGGDIHPAMLEPGEAVVPKHLVSGVAPYLKSHGVPGFEGGGIMGGGGHVASGALGGGGTMEAQLDVRVYLDSTQMQRSQQVQTLRYNIRNNGKATGVWKPV